MTDSKPKIVCLLRKILCLTTQRWNWWYLLYLSLYFIVFYKATRSNICDIETLKFTLSLPPLYKFKYCQIIYYEPFSIGFHGTQLVWIPLHCLFVCLLWFLKTFYEIQSYHTFHVNKPHCQVFKIYLQFDPECLWNSKRLFIRWIVFQWYINAWNLTTFSIYLFWIWLTLLTQICSYAVRMNYRTWILENFITKPDVCKVIKCPQTTRKYMLYDWNSETINHGNLTNMNLN